MFEEALTKRLKEAPALAPLLDGRVFWMKRPDAGQLPALTLSVAGEDRSYNHDAPDDLQEVRLQLDVRAMTALEAKQVSRAVLFELEKPETVDGVSFAEAIQASAVDAPRENLGAGTEVFRVIRDVHIRWSQV